MDFVSELEEAFLARPDAGRERALGALGAALALRVDWERARTALLSRSCGLTPARLVGARSLIGFCQRAFASAEERGRWLEEAGERLIAIVDEPDARRTARMVETARDHRSASVPRLLSLLPGWPGPDPRYVRLARGCAVAALAVPLHDMTMEEMGLRAWNEARSQALALDGPDRLRLAVFGAGAWTLAYAARTLRDARWAEEQRSRLTD